MDDCEAWVALRYALDGVDVLVHGVEVSAGAEAVKDGACVASAAEGDVDVCAVGPDVKCIKALGEECGYVIGVGLGHWWFQSIQN